MLIRTATDRGGRRSRLRRRSVRLGLVALSAFLIWSVSNTVAAGTPGSRICRPTERVGTAAYLAGDACPPADFAATMGYEPVLVRTPYGWRYEKPAWAGGACSGPLSNRGLFWDFGHACRTHDYGYDLVRFGVGDRDQADALLYLDMMASCRGQSVTGIPGCRAIARWAHTVLVVGDATGFDPEPVVHAS